MKLAAPCLSLPPHLQRLADEAEQRKQRALERLTEKLDLVEARPEVEAALRELIDADKGALLTIGNHRSRR